MSSPSPDLPVAPESSLVEGSEEPGVIDRLYWAADSCRGVAEVCEVLKAVVPHDPRGDQIAHMAQGLLDRAFRLGALPPESEEFAQHLDELESGVAALEQQLIDIDTTISADDFIHRFSIADLPVEFRLRYAALLAKYVNVAPERAERVQVIAHDLLTIENSDGTHDIVGREQVDIVLAYIVGRTRAKESVRSSSTSFFHSATRRLHEVSKLVEIFESDLYFDIEGFKIALRDSVLDSDILYGTIRLSMSLHNRIEKLAQEELFLDSELIQRKAVEEKRLRGIFGARPQDIVGSEFEWLRREKGKRKYRSLTWADYARGAGIGIDVQRRQLMLKGVGILATVGIGLQLYKLYSQPKVVDLTPAELAELSALLETGGISDKGHRIFIGRFTSNRWLLLSRSDRQGLAKDIVSKLKERKVRAAVIFSEGEVVIQIAGGGVLVVR